VRRLPLVLFAISAAFPVLAHSNLHAQLFRATRIFETQGFGLARDATLEFPDLPQDHNSRKRLWRDVFGSDEVKFEEQVLYMKIIRASSSRATVDAKVRSLTYYNGRRSDGGPTYAGQSIITDRIEFQRTHGEWEITAVVRRVRRVVS
jgi:hypothetical protein